MELIDLPAGLPVNRIGNQVFSVEQNLDPANYAALTAPVAYPHIWDTSWFEWVQYNASIMQGYLDAERRRYIHLVDGGISDNLGVRAFLDTMITVGALSMPPS